MNKIFLIIVLIASSYGHTYMVLGLGTSECGEVSALAQNIDSPGLELYLIHAQGAFSAMNGLSEIGYLNIPNKVEFSPKKVTLKLLIKKYCDENLTDNFQDAVMSIWAQNAK